MKDPGGKRNLVGRRRLRKPVWKIARFSRWKEEVSKTRRSRNKGWFSGLVKVCKSAYRRTDGGIRQGPVDEDEWRDKEQDGGLMSREKRTDIERD